MPRGVVLEEAFEQRVAHRLAAGNPVRRVHGQSRAHESHRAFSQLHVRGGFFVSAARSGIFVVKMKKHNGAVQKEARKRVCARCELSILRKIEKTEKQWFQQRARLSVCTCLPLKNRGVEAQRAAQ